MMRPYTIKPSDSLKGSIRLPGDKSVSHRAVMCAALAKGVTRINNFLFCDDCEVTLDAFKAMGVRMATDRASGRVTVRSTGTLRAPRKTLDMNESGTSARLLMGLLSSQPFSARVDGAPSLRRRPMGRVTVPLRRMGACLKARRVGAREFLPVDISSAEIKGISWRQEIASAQVKSALLLAGLFAEGVTRVVEPVASRDHTERMLKFFGAKIRRRAGVIDLKPSCLVSPGSIIVPGDFSSAAFFIVAALLSRKARVQIKGVSVNPTRTGLLRVLRRMGAKVRVARRYPGFEPVADLEVSSCALRATTVEPREIPSLIDELPILMVAAARARGTTVIKGAGELRVKETDRTKAMRSNLSKLGVPVRVKSQGRREDIEIQGVEAFPAASFKSFGDHRTAMSCLVAGLSADGPCAIEDTRCINKSFPSFLATLKYLIVR